MPAKGKGAEDRTKPVAEQILVEAARIYDARQEDTDSKDLKTYAGFLSKQDAFTKVCPPRTRTLAHAAPLAIRSGCLEESVCPETAVARS